METFREEFLAETISNLQNLQLKLKSNEPLNSYSTELAHQLHTIKGSSMTFDLHIQGKFIHELESLIQAEREQRIVRKEWVKAVLDESFAALLNLFEQASKNETQVFPQELSTKIGYLIEPEKSNAEVSLPGSFPNDLRTQLSSAELRNLQSSLLNGNHIFLIEVSFLSENFTEEFKVFRQILDQKCEVIGTFMVTTFASENITFRLLLTTKINQNELISLINSAQGKIIYAYLNEKTELSNDENSLKNIVSQAISNGKQSARKLGKEIDFEVSLLDIELPEKHLEAVSIAFLHLIRNAVDHGIESKEDRQNAQKLPHGHISIEASVGKNIFRAMVKDDGRGIETTKVYETAVQKKLIETNTKLSDEEIWEFIFQPNFSTSLVVTEISGRGIGLDAVKTAIKQVNGEIRVQSITGRGTEFEIYLPM
jgi:two-component system, chemotaxis family, sensor kinase CheA